MRRHTRAYADPARVLLVAVLLLGVTAGRPAAAQGVTVRARQDTTRIADLTRMNKLNRWYTTGYKYFQIGEYADAIPAFKAYTGADSSNTEAWGYLAICYVQTNQMPEARDAYLALLRQDVTEEQRRAALEGLAWVYNELGDALAYRATYEELAERHPEEPEYRTRVEALLKSSGDDEAMIRYLEEQAKKHPDDPVIHQQLSEIYRKQGDDRAQALSLEESLTREPDNAEVLGRLGKLYLEELSRSEDAVRIYSHLSEVRPEDSQAWRQLAKARVAAQDLTGAVPDYERAIEHAPDEIRLKSELAQVLSDLKRYDEAETWVGKAVAQSPEDGYAYVTWGNILSAKAFSLAAPDGTLPYEAKVVIEEAIAKFQNGAKSQSLTTTVRDFARRRVEELQPYTPTAAERFMHRARDTKIPPLAG